MKEDKHGRTKARFALPTAEDDLWHQVVVRLLAQRDMTEQHAANPLRLLEEWAFHQVVCGQRQVTRRWLECMAEWIVQTEPRRGPATAVSHWIDDLEAWDFVSCDADGIYEFAIQGLEEYFAARHLTARWTEGDQRYHAWLPHLEARGRHGKTLRCPNPYCNTLLPSFHDVLHQTDYEEVILLTVGLLQNAENEGRLLRGMQEDLNLTLKALSRCRWSQSELLQGIMKKVLQRQRLPIEHGLAALGQARTKENLDPLLNFCIDALHQKAWARDIAASVLGQIRDVRAAKSLVAALLTDTSSVVRTAAAQALGRLPDSHVWESLKVVLLKDNAWLVRLAAVQALGQIGSLQAADVLIAALKDPTDEVRLEAIRILGRIEPLPAVDVLIAALKDPDHYVRLEAVRILGRIEDTRVVESLVAMLMDSDQSVYRTTFEILNNPVGNVHILKYLNAMLSNGDFHARLRAIWVLEQLDITQTIWLLTNALGDRDREVQARAVVALGRMGDRRVIPILQTFIHTSSRLVPRRNIFIARCELLHLRLVVHSAIEQIQRRTSCGRGQGLSFWRKLSAGAMYAAALASCVSSWCGAVVGSFIGASIIPGVWGIRGAIIGALIGGLSGGILGIISGIIPGVVYGAIAKPIDVVKYGPWVGLVGLGGMIILCFNLQHLPFMRPLFDAFREPRNSAVIGVFIGTILFAYAFLNIFSGILHREERNIGE